MEAYIPDQIALGTGGPCDPAVLAPLQELEGELSDGLDLVVAREVEREIREGTVHDGLSATAQLIGVLRA
jgi:hypothetical protein